MTADDEHRWAALALELAPAALFNFAVAFTVATVFRQMGLPDLAAAASVAAGIAAFLLAWYWLRRVEVTGRGFALPQFDEPEYPDEQPEREEEPGELLLTERLESLPIEQQSASDELLLDDILEKIGPESRVVRLFDPDRVPTAGELQAQIDRHLRSGSEQASPPDATQALYEAILELRQSLR